MSLRCEFSARYIIPALRLMIARKLIDEYGLTQSEVARLLGVTQPSISHYLNSKRGIKMERTLLRSSEVRKYIDNYARRIASSRSFKSTSLCRLCKVAFRHMIKKKRGLGSLK